MAALVFLVVTGGVVIAFLVVTARNSTRYAESLQPPEDLRRAGETTDPSGGSPNGGNIWPGQ